jgi:hypothetical protein
VVLSFGVRRPLRAINLLLLIVAVAPRHGATQPAPGDDAEDALARIAERIVAAQASGGPYARELIDPLTSLSVLYQGQGDYALEAAALEQALHVIRANYGLRSLEQAPLIRQRIQNEESVGNYAAAWDLEQALLTLARRHPDDLRAAPIFHEIGDKRTELLTSYLAGDFPPQLVLGCFYEPPTRFPDPNDSRNRYGDDHGGRQSLVRRIYDDRASSEPLLTRIERLLELADWDLAFGQRTLALDLYAEIHEFLKKEGFPQTTIDEISSSPRVAARYYVHE